MVILIIEDCRVMTFLWKLQAKEAGHITTCVEYKHDALELLRSNVYDLIILDNNLNGELGTEIAKEIKDITKTKIILSSADDDLVGNEFIDDVISKKQLNFKDLCKKN
jgi:DNA-binding response OmpR family regulator